MLTANNFRIPPKLLVLLSLSITTSFYNTELNGLLFEEPTVVSVDTNDSSSCAPWKYQKTPNSTCECGSTVGRVVQCTN